MAELKSLTPAEPGWYARTIAVGWDLPEVGVYTLTTSGHWYHDGRRVREPLALRLTRLAPEGHADAALARIAALHTKYTYSFGLEICKTCGEDNRWPCETIRAIDGDA